MEKPKVTLTLTQPEALFILFALARVRPLSLSPGYIRKAATIYARAYSAADKPLEQLL